MDGGAAAEMVGGAAKAPASEALSESPPDSVNTGGGNQYNLQWKISWGGKNIECIWIGRYNKSLNHLSCS